MSPSFPVKIAVLDDYQGFSEPKYGALDPAKYEVSFFKDTLRPYNHPDTTQDEKNKLVKRLEPFTVICEYCNVFFLWHICVLMEWCNLSWGTKTRRTSDNIRNLIREQKG